MASKSRTAARVSATTGGVSKARSSGWEQPASDSSNNEQPPTNPVARGAMATTSSGLGGILSVALHAAVTVEKTAVSPYL
jgi:hypothetical protein